MKVQYLGTGASEGIPCAFCGCPVCAGALAAGGRDVRSRACVLVEDDLLVDLPPDLWGSCLKLKRSLSRLETLLITHEHREHFYLNELRNFFPPYTLTRESGGLTIFGNRFVEAQLHELLTPAQRDVVNFHLVKPFKPVSHGAYTVTPLAARHCEDALVYLIQRGGKTMLYGTDTGFLPERTWDYLAGTPIHLVSLDCTNPVNKDTPNHMNLEDAMTTRRRLYQIGCTTPQTKLLITHISHNSGLNHAQLEEHVHLHGVRVAYDGLELEF